MRPHERELVREARRLMRLHADMAELIRLGAYRSGANAELDRAIAVHPALERILEQDATERSSADAAFSALAAALGDGVRVQRPSVAAPLRRSCCLRLEKHALDEERLALAGARGRAGGSCGRNAAAAGRRLAAEHAPRWDAAGRAAPASAAYQAGRQRGSERCSTRRGTDEQAVAQAQLAIAGRLRGYKALELAAREMAARAAAQQMKAQQAEVGRGRRGARRRPGESELGRQRHLAARPARR